MLHLTIQWPRFKGIQDVKIKDKILQIVLRHSKTDQINKGVTIVLNSPKCPVHCMIDYMQIRPKISGPLYCHFNGKPITRYQFLVVMGKALAVLGFNSQLYTTHSFRMVQLLLQLGKVYQMRK